MTDTNLKVLKIVSNLCWQWTALQLFAHYHHQGWQPLKVVATVRNLVCGHKSSNTHPIKSALCTLWSTWKKRWHGISVTHRVWIQDCCPQGVVHIKHIWEKTQSELKTWNPETCFRVVSRWDGFEKAGSPIHSFKDCCSPDPFHIFGVMGRCVMVLHSHIYVWHVHGHICTIAHLSLKILNNSATSYLL